MGESQRQRATKPKTENKKNVNLPRLNFSKQVLKIKSKEIYMNKKNEYTLLRKETIQLSAKMKD